VMKAAAARLRELEVRAAAAEEVAGTARHSTHLELRLLIKWHLMTWHRHVTWRIFLIMAFHDMGYIDVVPYPSADGEARSAAAAERRAAVSEQHLLRANERMTEVAAAAARDMANTLLFSAVIASASASASATATKSVRPPMTPARPTAGGMTMGSSTPARRPTAGKRRSPTSTSAGRTPRGSSRGGAIGLASSPGYGFAAAVTTTTATTTAAAAAAAAADSPRPPRYRGFGTGPRFKKAAPLESRTPFSSLAALSPAASGGGFERSPGASPGGGGVRDAAMAAAERERAQAARGAAAARVTG